MTPEIIAKETCFVIGNGESRLIWEDWNKLKGKGTVYGCNAIVRDFPKLCDKVFIVNEKLYNETVDLKTKWGITGDIVGADRFSTWNYILEGDHAKNWLPPGLKLYRIWQGGDAKKGQWRIMDLSKTRGSGCSAVLAAAEAGFKNVFLIGFDIVGSRQWEYNQAQVSREQNNVYKNTNHYPHRMNMKAYLKYEWMYQLTQIAKRFPKTKFIHINRKENITCNMFLPHYFRYAGGNCRATHYGQLQKFLDNPVDYWNTLLWLQR